MKILHCCLSGGYTENCAYQENILTGLHVKHGHEVLVIASDETVEDGKFSRSGPGEFVTADGVRVIRIAPSRAVPPPLRYKLRFFPDFERHMKAFGPDVIYFHSVAAHELLTAARYKRAHPGTALLADSHAVLNKPSNPASGFVSKNLQHKGYYRSLYRRVRGDLDALYYIGINERDYLTDVIGAAPDRISFLPLGGIIAGEEERQNKRRSVRRSENIPEDSLLMCFSGKIDAKKRPEMMLRAMELCDDPRLRLVIIGSAQDEYQKMIDEAARKDGRITCLGWRSAEELRDHLCASDLYVLPGKVSATAQNALCCGTPVLAYRHYTYTEQFGEDGGMLFFETAEQLASLIGGIASGRLPLDGLREKAMGYAREKLDYERQAGLIESFGSKRTGAARK